MSTFSELFLKLKAQLPALAQTQVTALNGVLDKLPEALKKDFLVLRDSLQSQQTALLELFATPPANEDATLVLQGMATAFTKAQDFCGTLLAQLQASVATFQTSHTALQGLQAKIDGKELLAPGQVKELTDAAFQNGVASVMPQVTAMRKSTIALAGLPDAPEAILTLDAPAFEASVTRAKTHLGILGEKFGFALNGRGDSWIKENIFQDETAFGQTVKKISDVLPASPGGDPLLGTGAGAGKNGKRLRIC